MPIRRKIPALVVIASTFIFSLSLKAANELNSLHSEVDSNTVVSAINTLDHFMLAGGNLDYERGASLMANFETDTRRTVYNTRRLYKKEEKLFSHYRSISSDIYGYEINQNLLGTSVSLEGGIETTDGTSKEFSAKLIYRHKRWLISQLDID